MQAATVDNLVRKGRFEPQVAVAISESIDMAIQNAQLVTVPILDARLMGLEARMGSKLEGMDGKLSSLEARMDAPDKSVLRKG